MAFLAFGKKINIRALKTIVSMVILLALFFFALTFARADSETDRLIQEKTLEFDKIIAAQNQKIAEKEAQAKTLKGDIAQLNDQIGKAQDQINDMSNKLVDIQKDLDAIDNDIKLNEFKLENEQDKLKQGIRMLYERGNYGAIEVLAESGSLSSILDQESYLRAVDGQIFDSVKSIHDIKNLLDMKRGEQAKKLEDQKSLLGEEERKKEELQTQILAKNKLLAETKGDEKVYQQILNQALENKSQVASIVAALSSGASPTAIGLPYSGARAGQRIHQGEVIARSGNTGFSTAPHLHFGLYQNGQDIDPMPLLSVGIFSFPVPGAPITQGFWGTFSHRGRGSGWPGGIDFGTPEGTPVRAAKDGVIIFEGVGKGGVGSGFGHYIIIDHQNGYLTLYGHLR